MKNLFLALFFLFPQIVLATATTNQVNAYSYAGGSVLTSAYTVIVQNTPLGVNHIQICDTSTKLVKLASGVPGSEIDLFVAPVSGCLIVPYYLPAGSILSIKAIDATASSGYNIVSFLK